MRFGCRSRYISRYVNLKFGFLPFVVASIVAMVFLRRICSSRPGDGEQRGQSLAALTACTWGLDCFQPQRMAACLTCRPDVVCPNRLGGMMQPAKAAHGAFLARPSWGPRKAGWLCGERRSSVVIELSCLHGSERYAACFDEVVARAVRVSQPAVLSALLVIQLFGIMIPPPFPLKSTKRSAAAIIRPQRSFITFHGALRNILLSTGLSTMFHIIASEQMFVNNLSQKIFLAAAASESNRFYQ